MEVPVGNQMKIRGFYGKVENYLENVKRIKYFVAKSRICKENGVCRAIVMIYQINHNTVEQMEVSARKRRIVRELVVICVKKTTYLILTY